MRHLYALSVFIILFSNINASEKSQYFTSPDAVTNLLNFSENQKHSPSLSIKQYEVWKETLESTYGLRIAGDYHISAFTASNSLGDEESVGGVFRIFGEWKIADQLSSYDASIVFKVEHRHALTNISPVDFASEIGYAGLVQSTYSDQKLRLTDLYWKQHFNDKEGIIYAGFLDVTEYVDIYLLISPWDAFGNMVFATGSATMGGLPDGALGVMAAGWLNNNTYIVAGIADANGNAADPFNQVDNFFKDFKTFKSFEIGWTTGRDKLFFDNFHITLWQIDARPIAATKEGWGINFSLTHTIDDQWMTFLRGGYSKDGGALLEQSLSSGFGYKVSNSDDIIGVGLNWGISNDEFYGKADAQWTSELFYRYQVNKDIQITPSLQFIANPVLNTKTDTITLLGLRVEAIF
jgi:porin